MFAAIIDNNNIWLIDISDNPEISLSDITLSVKEPYRTNLFGWLMKIHNKANIISQLPISRFIFKRENGELEEITHEIAYLLIDGIESFKKNGELPDLSSSMPEIMANRFKNTIDYLSKLKEKVLNQEKNLSSEERLLAIIQDSILSSEQNSGCIIFTKEDGNYRVSDIQRHSYGNILQGAPIDISSVIVSLEASGIKYELKPHPIGNNKNDYKLSFEIEMKQGKNKIKTREEN